MKRTPFIHVTKVIEDEQGSSFIELSLILPVLLVMLLGVVDLGLVFSQYMTVIDSARAAAEYSTIYGQRANMSQVQTFATQFAAGVPSYSASASLVCTCSPGGSATSCTSSCGGAVTTPLQYTLITATATLPLIFHLTGLPASLPVKSVAIIRTPYTKGN